MLGSRSHKGRISSVNNLGLKLHILFLTDNFPPEVNAPASRVFEHCLEWARAGERVTVITCAPNFPKGVVYDGYYNYIWQSSEIENIKVIRVWSYISANEGFIKRILDYLSFMFSAILAALFVLRVDLVVGTSPQFFTVCAAYIVSRAKRIPFVFELRDLWPESIQAVSAMKADGLIYRWLVRIEIFLYHKASKIVVVTYAFKEYLIARGVHEAKIDVVTNGADLEYFFSKVKDQKLIQQLNLRGMFVAGYIGTHGMAHALETLLEAALILQKNSRAENVRLLFLGDGALKSTLITKAAMMGLNNVVFLESVPKDQISRYWSILDVSIIHLRKVALFTSVIPSKLFESMAMGIPILHGIAGESADIVLREDIGEVFGSENALQLADRLLYLLENPATLARYKNNGVLAAQMYDRKKLARKMLRTLKDSL